MSEKTREEVEIDPETGFVVEGQKHGQTVEGPQSGASLDQVREILFGSHTRNFEQRLTQVERGLEQAVSNLTDEMTGRIDKLDNLIKNELKDLLDKLGKQREERSALFQQLKNEIESSCGALEKRIDELSERVDNVHNDTQGELRRQVETINEEMEQKVGGFKQDLTTEAGRLRAEMVDRTALSSLFSELALRMTNLSDSRGQDPTQTVVDTLDEVLGSSAPDSA